METTHSTAALVSIPENASPFTKVYGLTVIIRTCLALDKGGVSTIYLPKSREAEITKWIKKRKDWNASFQFSDDYKNELSTISENLMVLSEPLVVDLKIIKGLIEEGNGKESVMTAGVDEMAFFSKKVVDQIKTDAEGNLGSLLKIAASKGVSTKNIDFAPLICKPIRNKEDKKAAKKIILGSLVKPTDGIVSRNLNRPISTSFSRVLVKTQLTPNQWTYLNGILSFIPCYFMYQGGYMNWLIGAGLVHLSSVLDGVDGEIARMKMKSSAFGQWLDTMLDHVSGVAVLITLVIGVHRVNEPAFFQWSGKLSIIFAVLSLASLLIYIISNKKEGSFYIDYSFKEKDTTFAKIIQAADFLGKRDFYNLLFFVLAIFGLMPWALFYICVMTVLVFIFVIQTIIHNARKKA